MGASRYRHTLTLVFALNVKETESNVNEFSKMDGRQSNFIFLFICQGDCNNYFYGNVAKYCILP